MTIDVTGRHDQDARLRLAELRAELGAKLTGFGAWMIGPSPEDVVWDEQMYRLRGLDPSDPAAQEAMAQWPVDRLRADPVAKREFWPRLRALRRPR